MRGSSTCQCEGVASSGDLTTDGHQERDCEGTSTHQIQCEGVASSGDLTTDGHQERDCEGTSTHQSQCEV